MTPVRQCSRQLCVEPAVATLTYVYADSTLVLGPLSTFAEPHCYDLCAQHSTRVIPPMGWELVKLDADAALTSRPSQQDIEALAAAVRQAAAGAAGAAAVNEPPAAGRRGHLHVVPTAE